jgi:spore germination protein YaaH/uncharacterized protein YkuJ
VRRLVLIVFTFLFILSVAAGVIYSVWRLFYVPNFLPNEKVVEAFTENEMNLVIEGEHITGGQEPLVVDEEIMLPIETIKKYFDKYIYWDESLKKVIVTTEDKVIRMSTGNLEALVNDEPMTLNIPAIEKNGTVYVPIEFLDEFYGIEIKYIEDRNVVIIDYFNRMKQVAEPLTEEAVVRQGRSIRHPIIRKFDFTDDEDNLLRVYAEHDKWYKVRTWDGAIGYIEKKYVVVRWVTSSNIPYEQYTPDPAWKPESGKINLVWEMMYGGRPDLSAVGSMEGLDVLSPTWFQLLNEEGQLINRCDAKYVEWAHDRGYKVWALLSNDFGNIEMTEKFLNNTDARDRLIKDVLAYASLYELDGINIDFENVYLKDKDALTQFVREITPLLREQGLVVSIDVGVPDGSETYSRCYDLKALGETVDYVMLMTYDQHWATSPKAGSVAQYEWVENRLERTLEMVPEDKLLLGLPFYIRLWEEKPDDSGKIKVSSIALTMPGAIKRIEENMENDLNVSWDEESGQFYVEYKKDGATYKMWFEDENSINLKSSLVHKYHLAGTAAWSRGFELPGIWMALNENLKETGDYFAWKEKNEDEQYVFKAIDAEE